MDKKIAWLALLLVLLSGCVGLTAYDFPSWFFISLIAIIISVMVVSLVYMAGSILSIDELVAWAKNELFQTCAAAMLIGIAIVFMSFLGYATRHGLIFGLTANYGPPVPAGDPFVATPFESMEQLYAGAHLYLTNLSLLLSTHYLSLTFLQVVVGIFEGITLRLMPGGVGFNISLSAIFAPISHFIGYGITALGTGIWAVQIQIGILEFSKRYMFDIFLPLGIVFRSFPFTRAVGGALIAISLGFYVVYPLTFVINMSLAERHFTGIATSDTFTGDTNTIVDFNQWVFSFSRGDIFQTGTVLDTFNFGWYMLKMFFSTTVTYLIVPTEALFQLTTLLDEVFYVVIVYAIIFPIINVFITLTFVRGLAGIFGSDINLDSITRLL
jgi:hypothetical protein